MVKIGLIAPFEGLYRRTGYNALESVRAAIAEYPAADAGLLPLALDDANDPAHALRSAQKLLADQGVGAIVGPLTPATAASVAPALADASLPWIAPFAVDPAGGFADPRTATAWAEGLVAAVGAATQQQGATRLMLAGWTPGWPDFSAEQWQELAGLPVTFVDAPTEVQATDAVFWLGSADGGAEFLNGLRLLQPPAPFWLGPAGGDPVFVERVNTVEQVGWATWAEIGYTSESGPYLSTSFFDHLVTQAARQAIAMALGAPLPSAPRWRVQLFALDHNGLSVPLSVP